MQEISKSLEGEVQFLYTEFNCDIFFEKTLEARELYFMCKQRKIGIYLDFKICKLKDRQCFDTYSQDDWAKKETITDGMFLQNDIDMQKKNVNLYNQEK